MIKYALWGEKSGQHLTWRGKVITHTNRAELEYLIKGVRVVQVRGVPPEEEIPIQFVPGFEKVQFPLKREDFR